MVEQAVRAANVFNGFSQRLNRRLFQCALVKSASSAKSWYDLDQGALQEGIDTRFKQQTQKEMQVLNRQSKLTVSFLGFGFLLAGVLLIQAQTFRQAQSGRPQTPTPPTFPSDPARQTATSAPASGSPIWEYRIVQGVTTGNGLNQYVVLKPSGRTVQLEEEINAFGALGFEVHSFTPLEAQGTTVGLSVLLKRVKP